MPPATARPRRYRWLALIPPLAILVGVPLVNGIRGYVLGLPVLLFWIVCCVLLTSLVMAVVGALDARADRADALSAAAARTREER
jgi:hypothetical protein